MQGRLERYCSGVCPVVEGNTATGAPKQPRSETSDNQPMNGQGGAETETRLGPLHTPFMQSNVNRVHPVSTSCSAPQFWDPLSISSPQRRRVRVTLHYCLSSQGSQAWSPVADQHSFPPFAICFRQFLNLHHFFWLQAFGCVSPGS